MKKLTLCWGLFMFLAFSSFAQRNCGTMDHLHWLEQQDPQLRDNMQKIEKQTGRMMGQTIPGLKNNVITIPVVVHVLYRTATENISDGQILSQIQVLNDDFRRLNADANQTLSQFVGVASDVEVQFCLANRDPQGNATNGITRTSTTVSSFGTNDNIKFASSGGRNAWPTGSYLNIWVGNIGGGILGYAQFPGGNASTDGVVVDYRYFGTSGTATAPFNKGRTATHEVGHWLNLRHIWGDGGCSVDDGVSDTPIAGGPNYGCPLTNVSCSSLDMVQNYMDYTDDACMNLFTQGQKSRMRALFAAGGFRAGLLNSLGCSGTAPAPTCNDGVQNGNETGVDCGGSCSPCQQPSGCLTYCAARGNSTADEFIQQVTIGTINNTSGNNNGYAFFNTPNSFQAGSNVSFSLRPGWTGTVYAEYFRIYADWNRDGDFLDAGELIFDQGAASTSGNVSGNFTIPAAASLGRTVLRVMMKYNAAPTSCEAFSWGEVEDYCVEIVAAPQVCNVTTSLSVANVTANSASLSWSAVSGASSYNVRLKPVSSSTWTTASTSGTTINATSLIPATPYEFQVQTVCSFGSSNFSTSTTFTTICSDVYEPNESRTAAKTIPVNTNINGSIAGTTDRDWYRFSTTSSARNIRITLTNLPADYDVVLYNSNGSTLRSSTNGSTSSETITWNTSSFGTYFIQVYGYNGANNPNVCYNLNVSTRSTSFRTLEEESEAEPTIPKEDEQPEFWVQQGFEGVLQLYPNPGQNQCQIELSIRKASKATISVLDIHGRIAMREVKSLDAGTHSFDLRTESLPSGLYLIDIQWEGHRSLHRWIRQ